MKKVLPILLILGVVIALFLFLSGPDKYNWSKNFKTKDDNPYGCYVTFKMLPHIFTKKITELSNRTIAKHEEYEVYELDDITTSEWDDDNLYTDYDEDDEYIVDYTEEEVEEDNSIPYKNNHNYVVISEHFWPGLYESKSLLYHAKKGNDVLLAAENMSSEIRDALDFGINQHNIATPDSVSLNFNSDEFRKNNDYLFKKGSVDHYISFHDESKSEIIAENDRGKPVLIKVKYGKGNFFICTTPVVFANYNVLDSINHEFASTALSHVGDKDLVWISTRTYNLINRDMQSTLDPERIDRPEDNRASKLALIKENPPLLWAFWLTIIIGGLFILFGAKRRQKTIPIVKPVTNSTVAFVKIIADLYFQKADHKNIASKKISFFLEYIRSGFNVKTLEFNEEMFHKISERSGVKTEKIETLFEKIAQVSNKKQITQGELLAVTNLMENFKKESKI